MQRYSYRSLTNNADAAALETARAALTAADGHAVFPGAKVTILATVTSEAILAGSLVGFARLPATLNADRSVATWRWMRWAGGDVDLNSTDAPMEVVRGPIEVPPGATAIISLPLAIQSTSAVTTVQLGIFSTQPLLVG